MVQPTSGSPVTPSGSEGVPSSPARDLSHLVPVATTTSTSAHNPYFDQGLYIFPSHMGNLVKLDSPILLQGSGNEIILKTPLEEITCKKLHSGKVLYEGREFANLKDWVQHITFHHFTTTFLYVPNLRDKQASLLLYELVELMGSQAPLQLKGISRVRHSIHVLGKQLFPTARSEVVIGLYRDFINSNPDLLKDLAFLPEWLEGLPVWLNQALCESSPKFKELYKEAAPSLELPKLSAVKVVKKDGLQNLSDAELKTAFQQHYALGFPDIKEVFSDVLKSRSLNLLDYEFLLKVAYDDDAKYFIEFLGMHKDAEIVRLCLNFQYENALTFMKSIGLDTTALHEVKVEALTARKILGQPIVYDPNKSWMQYLLNADISDVVELAGNSEGLQQALYYSTFIARNPSSTSQAEMVVFYSEEIKDHATQQMEFAQARIPNYEKMASRLGKLCLHDAYKLLSERRRGDYEKFRTIEVTTPILGRYFPNTAFIHQARLSGDPSIEHTDEGYIVKHTLANGEVIPLTRIITGYKEPHGKILLWDHTYPDQLKDVLNEMSSLFYQMQVSKEGLETNLVRFYWLGAHACTTLRGNAQYMLELMNGLRRFHGLNPLAPARFPSAFPDCVALCTSERSFQQVFKNLFEEVKLKLF